MSNSMRMKWRNELLWGREDFLIPGERMTNKLVRAVIENVLLLYRYHMNVPIYN